MSNYDEARKFATDYLRERRGLLTPEVGREFESVQMANIISLLWSTLGKQALDEQARELVKAAATSPAAYGAARHMVLYHIDHDKPLPPALEQFHRAVLMGAAPPESKTGWGSANYGRDATIACIVNELVGRFGLKCTRNSASKKPSACSIVADALAKSGCAISEKAVERVVGKMDRLGVVFYFSSADPDIRCLEVGSAFGAPRLRALLDGLCQSLQTLVGVEFGQLLQRPPSSRRPHSIHDHAKRL